MPKQEIEQQKPNIDKLAEYGMKFTQHYSGSTVCAPSRSSLMTGQHTDHTFIRGNKEVQPEGQNPLEAEAYTLAEALQDASYATGVFGKRGLGYPDSEGGPTSLESFVKTFRKAFNGKYMVIIQLSQNEGEIILNATSIELLTGKIKITTHM